MRIAPAEDVLFFTCKAAATILKLFRRPTSEKGSFAILAVLESSLVFVTRLTQNLAVLKLFLANLFATRPDVSGIKGLVVLVLVINFKVPSRATLDALTALGLNPLAFAFSYKGELIVAFLFSCIAHASILQQITN